MSDVRYFVSKWAGPPHEFTWQQHIHGDKDRLGYHFSFDGETLEIVTWGDRMPEFPEPWIELDLGSAGKWRGQATAPPEPAEYGMVRYRVAMRPYAAPPS